MANPIFNALNGGRANSNPLAQLVADAKKLQNSFKGNPKDEVQRLLNSGEMTQDQFNRLSQIANQIMGSGLFG